MRRQDHVILLLALAACGGGGGFPDASGAEPMLHPGEISVSWTLVDANNAPTTCAAANATKVLVGITDASGSRDTSSFDCTLDSAITGALFVATYDLDFTLVGTAGTAIATTAPQHGVAVQSNMTTKLSAIMFVIDATAQVDAIAAAAQPRLDALVARIGVLKHKLRGNLPGWQDKLRLADAANDTLGLPPFTQVQAPGPEWRPSPGSLLGIGAYVHGRAGVLAPEALKALADDEKRRYDLGIASTSESLDAIDKWLVHR